MLNHMLCALWALVALHPQPTPAEATELNFGPRTILVYQNESGRQTSEFVVRLARFGLDILLEWESLAHQGTVQMTKECVENAESFTLSSLFEAGVDTESADVMTKWLPRKIYRELLEKGKGRMKFNNIPTEFRLTGDGSFGLELNKSEVKVSAIEVEDSRKGKWKFLKNPANPVLLEYSSRYYTERLACVSTSSENRLRWIKKRP